MHYAPQFAQTERLKIAYYHMGQAGKPKLMLIHGNASSAVFYLPLMERLKDDFEIIAPDLRGFGDTEALPIDATQGMKQWSDDLHALITALGWDRFGVMGWSMGGAVAEQYAIDHSECITGMILLAPCSPFGFGGTAGPEGRKLEPLNIASGAGVANQQLIAAMAQKDREFMRTMLRNVYCKPGFLMASEWEELMIDGILSTRLGDGFYPGDVIPCAQWPFVRAGSRGICNTMAPEYCDTSALAEVPNKFPILWFLGDSDLVVGDENDINALGKRGVIPGWPGEEIAPPQPMVSQTRYVLDKYRENGGSYKFISVPNAAHAAVLEQEDLFVDEIKALLL